MNFNLTLAIFLLCIAIFYVTEARVVDYDISSPEKMVYRWNHSLPHSINALLVSTAIVCFLLITVSIAR